MYCIFELKLKLFQIVFKLKIKPFQTVLKLKLKLFQTAYKFNQNPTINNPSNQMGRTKQVSPTARPATSPLLEFEPLNPEGNKEDAVVYYEETGLLKYKGKNYVLTRELPEDYEITEAFLIENYRGEDIIFLNITSDDDDLQIRCSLTVIPSDEEKVKLTTMVKDFGAELTYLTKAMVDGVKRMKKMMNIFNDSVESACPGFNFYRDFDIELPTPESRQFRNMDVALEYLSNEAEKLSATEPFSKKRKSCD
jgi:hypothetical protein